MTFIPKLSGSLKYTTEIQNELQVWDGRLEIYVFYSKSGQMLKIPDFAWAT